MLKIGLQQAIIPRPKLACKCRFLNMGKPPQKNKEPLTTFPLPGDEFAFLLCFPLCDTFIIMNADCKLF